MKFSVKYLTQKGPHWLWHYLFMMPMNRYPNTSQIQNSTWFWYYVDELMQGFMNCKWSTDFSDVRLPFRHVHHPQFLKIWKDCIFFTAKCATRVSHLGCQNMKIWKNGYESYNTQTWKGYVYQGQETGTVFQPFFKFKSDALHLKCLMD